MSFTHYMQNTSKSGYYRYTQEKTAIYYLQTGNWCFNRRQFDEAISAYTNSIKLLKQNDENDKATLAKVLGKRASAYEFQNQLNEAMKDYALAITLGNKEVRSKFYIKTAAFPVLCALKFFEKKNSLEISKSIKHKVLEMMGLRVSDLIDEQSLDTWELVIPSEQKGVELKNFNEGDIVPDIEAEDSKKSGCTMF